MFYLARKAIPHPDDGSRELEYLIILFAGSLGFIAAAVGGIGWLVTKLRTR